MTDLERAESGLRRGMAFALLLAIPVWTAVGVVVWRLL